MLEGLKEKLVEQMTKAAIAIDPSRPDIFDRSVGKSRSFTNGLVTQEDANRARECARLQAKKSGMHL